MGSQRARIEMMLNALSCLICMYLNTSRVTCFSLHATSLTGAFHYSWSHNYSIVLYRYFSSADVTLSSYFWPSSPEEYQFELFIPFSSASLFSSPISMPSPAPVLPKDPLPLTSTPKAPAPLQVHTRHPQPAASVPLHHPHSLLISHALPNHTPYCSPKRYTFPCFFFW